MPLFDQNGCTVEAMSGGHYVRVERDGKLVGKLLIPSWIPDRALLAMLNDRGWNVGAKSEKCVLHYDGTAEDAAKVANAEDDKIEVVTVRDASSMSPAVPATSDGKTFIENGDGKMVPRTPSDPIQDPT